MSVAELPRIADVEKALSDALRLDERVTALVEDRVFTSWPHARDDTAQPLVLITRIGGAPVFSRPLVLDAASVQLDTYGGRKHAAWSLTATVAQALIDLHDRELEHGVIHGITIDAIRYVPDDSFSPPRARYVTDLTVTASPPRPSARNTTSPPPVAASSEGR